MSQQPPLKLRLKYFAWVREKIGIAEEDVVCPAGVETVQDLIEWQKTRGEQYAVAFNRPGVVRAAVDQTHAKAGQSISQASEIAFFPPVTGG